MWWKNILLLSSNFWRRFESVIFSTAFQSPLWVKWHAVLTVLLVTRCYILLLSKHAPQTLLLWFLSLSQTMKCHASLLVSTLKFDFGSSLSLWLTDKWAVQLHQKVQLDSLIWQASSDQIYSLFLALHQLDKRKNGNKKNMIWPSILWYTFHYERIEKKTIQLVFLFCYYTF